MNGRKAKPVSAEGSVTSDARHVTGTPVSATALVEASGLAGQDLPAGALYVVATPIGNAADLTLRAWWVLSHVDAIAAEDTRTTRHLLDRYAIAIPAGGLIAAHEHNERASSGRIVERLRAGERVALVTDAGTPAISDPGALVVRAVHDAGLRVVPVPGASAFTAALSVAGAIVGGDSSPVVFAGFLPAAPRARARRLEDLAARGDAFVLFEAPHRIAATAAELARVLEPARRVLVARELTKKFETVRVTTAGTLEQAIAAEAPRGEYVIVVDARAPDAARDAEASIDEVTRRWLVALREALPASRAAAVAARATGLPRALLYRELGAADDGGAA